VVYYLLIFEKKVLLNKASDDRDGTAPLGGYHQLRQQQWEKDMKELQNSAAQRSGTRGIQARKELLAFEKEYVLWQQRYMISSIIVIQES